MRRKGSRRLGRKQQDARLYEVSIYAFSDGSVHPDEDYHSTAAIRVYHRGEILHRHSFATGRATSFDAELAGLTSALHHSIKRAIARATTGTATHHIHLYADNAAALNSLFDTSLHSSQILSVMSCTRAKAWLSLSPHHRIHLHWVPGHQNVEENENVDSDATEAHTTYPRSPHVSAAYARQHVTTRLVDEWQQIPDLGHGFFPNAKLRKASHTRGGPLLSVVGISNTITARISRLIVNHAPIGEYRSRFFPTKPSNCPRCGVLETRHHILNSCPRYVRPRRMGFVEFLKNSAEPIPELVRFLARNPTSFTFADAPPT